MGVLHDNTSRIQGLIADISSLPKDRYEAGLEEGYTNGYADGRASLDVLQNIELAPWGAYYGKSLDSFGNQKIILLFTLKKGKTVPAGSFGYIRQPKSGGTTAGWTVTNGTYQPNYAYFVETPSNYESSLLGCYPGNQETWDAFMDAFEVRVELFQEEI